MRYAMTQEEVDTLMAGELEDMEEENIDGMQDESVEEEIILTPADDKHKVVAQLDEVTKESEEKAVQILDKMEEISVVITNTNEKIDKLIEFLNQQKEIFIKLHNAFPHIKKFEEELNNINEMIDIANEIKKKNENAEDEILKVMDIMQYQDIHRQKIERVINIMRALIKYMNKLFEGKIEDEKRVKSAKHLDGDETEEVVSDENIEKLLEEFGAK
jgi:septal ring factor EnvC (AmiA/AmiB activator)